MSSAPTPKGYLREPFVKCETTRESVPPGVVAVLRSRRPRPSCTWTRTRTLPEGVVSHPRDPYGPNGGDLSVPRVPCVSSVRPAEDEVGVGDRRGPRRVLSKSLSGIDVRTTPGSGDPEGDEETLLPP